MRKIFYSLLLLAGFLASTLAFTVTAPTASAAITCDSSNTTRTGDTAYSGLTPGAGGQYKNVHYNGIVVFKNCYDNGVRFIKVFQYKVYFWQDTDDCDNVDEFHVNPNALNWWNAPEDQFNCLSGGGSETHVFVPTGGFVNVYATLPSNERCIGATVVAGIAPGPDENLANVPTMCFLD